MGRGCKIQPQVVSNHRLNAKSSSKIQAFNRLLNSTTSCGHGLTNLVLYMYKVSRAYFILHSQEVNMYNFENFGKRLKDLRKAKGFSQEDMANKVGVTGQAISKWENDQSYPDITLMPTLATIFGVSVAHFFGEDQNIMQQPAAAFAKTYQNMPLVNSTKYVACYSNKTVESTDETGVKFTDGSTAELSTRMAVNCGEGEIVFVGSDSVGGWEQDEGNELGTPYECEFICPDDISISILSCTCTITRVPNLEGKVRVKAEGTKRFLKSLKVESVSGDENSLEISYMNEYGNNNNSHGKSQNKLYVELPQNYDCGKYLRLAINGSGSIRSDIPAFETGKLTINGSGVINVQDFTAECTASVNGSGDINGKNAADLVLSVNGSGDIAWEKAQTVKASVNGSGDIKIKEAHALNASVNGSGDFDIDQITGGDVTAKVHGSGDIKIKDGTCDNFNVDVHGAGDIDATGVTATKAHIVLHTHGNVILGRVLDGSTEQIKQKGTIKILKRGRAN